MDHLNQLPEEFSKWSRRGFISRTATLALVAALANQLRGDQDATQSKGCNAVMPQKKLREFSNPESVREAGKDLTFAAMKGVDLASFQPSYWREVKIESTFFLGCQFSPQSQALLGDKGAVIVPRFGGVPYDPFRYRLYSPEDLLRMTPSGKTIDQTIYCDFLSKGRLSPDIIEALCRRIHDDSIDDALAQLIREVGATNIVGFMGGSSSKRTDAFYRKTAQAARLVTLNGNFVTSGGGPGMMEAANLGAYFAKYSETDLDQALGILAKAPAYSDPDWIRTALDVKAKFPLGGDSLGVPTWFYGFEPTNAFATRIAKYFDNSIREGGLVQIGKAGVVFAPGSAGTRQEIFMDAAQNHYGTTGFYSPMIFLGKYQYQIDAPIYPLLEEVATSNYKDLLFISDEPSEIANFVKLHKPVAKPQTPDPICGCLPTD